MKPLVIVGAGLAGLLAAHAWPAAAVFESAPQPRAAHRAVLRFRSDAVARLTGIDFRRVTVRKGLWAEEGFRPPAIRWANAYAQKVVGRLLGERSVWNLETVDRWIAPDDLHEQLVAATRARITWGSAVDFSDRTVQYVNTAPLPVVLRTLGIEPGCEFPRAPIVVTRWRIPGADVFQTVYFPERGLNVYRASITGDTLIVEAVAPLDDEDCLQVERAFALDLDGCQPLGSVEQKYGKIAPIDDPLRKRLLFQLTHEHGVYSLGRFATWRNLLLDDVVDDISAIKRLLKTAPDSHPYELRRAAS